MLCLRFYCYELCRVGFDSSPFVRHRYWLTPTLDYVLGRFSTGKIWSKTSPLCAFSATGFLSSPDPGKHFSIKPAGALGRACDDHAGTRHFLLVHKVGRLPSTDQDELEYFPARLYYASGNCVCQARHRSALQADLSIRSGLVRGDKRNPVFGNTGTKHIPNLCLVWNSVYVRLRLTSRKVTGKSFPRFKPINASSQIFPELFLQHPKPDSPFHPEQARLFRSDCFHGLS